MRKLIIATIVTLVWIVTLVQAGETESLLAQIQAIGKEGKGNPQARQAWKALVAQGPSALLPILNAIDENQPVVANWLRSAVDAIAENELAAGRSLPKAALEKFALDTHKDGRSRRQAYELILRLDPQAADRFLPQMLQDPSVELRRDAVAVVLREAQRLLDAKDAEAAKRTFQKALAGARDKDQVDAIAKQLKTLGTEVDLAAHFGFLPTWHLIGPFEGKDDSGFATAYPPEKGVDLEASYTGKQDAKLTWNVHTTTDPYGMVDLNKAIAKHMGAVAYAYTVVEAPQAGPVEIRVGSNNAVKVFLNGQPLLAHEEYHHGLRMDQYVAKGQLRAGKNAILLKICQNEQTEQWAQQWSFQARLCDAVGTALQVKK
jgi:hypothetical protein